MVFQINSQSLTLLSQTVDFPGPVQKSQEKSQLSLKNLSVEELLAEFNSGSQRQSHPKKEQPMEVPKPKSEASSKPSKRIFLTRRVQKKGTRSVQKTDPKPENQNPQQPTRETQKNLFGGGRGNTETGSDDADDQPRRETGH